MECVISKHTQFRGSIAQLECFWTSYLVIFSSLWKYLRLKITKDVHLAVILGNRPGAVTQVGINVVESFKERSRSRETLECHWKQTSSANHSNACLWLCPIGGQHLSRCFRDLFIRSQSETNNWMSRGTGSLRVAYQGLSRTFSKTFAAVYTYPTDRPWVSEDVLQSATCLDTT